MLLPDAASVAATVEAEAFRSCFTPRSDLSILEWGETRREMSKETGAEGRWLCDQVPYLRAPLLALSDERVREVTIVKPAQSGATEGVVLNTIFYHVDHHPSPMLVAYPTEGEAEKFSKKKLGPAIRDTPCIAGRIGDGRSRRGDSTILEKAFPGGSIGIVGGASSRNFRMVSARILVADDVDGLDPAVAEGDQIVLMRQRANAFDDYKGLWVSSPGDALNSKIEPLFHSMERRGWFHVPCPHCGEMIELRFGGPDEPYGLKWEKEEAEDGTTIHHPETVAYLCEHCGALISEREKWKMAQAGDYLSEDGTPTLSIPARTYGFWYRGFVSLFANVSWANIVRAFLEAMREKNWEKLKVIVNTIFAETWEQPDEGDKVDPVSLEARAQLWVDPQGQRIEVPNGVGVLTGFADVQHDRIEVLVVGWGKDELAWVLLHMRLYGDTTSEDTYRRVDALRTKAYRHEHGQDLRIQAFGIDSGDGLRTSEVYSYVARHKFEAVYATKGQDHRQRDPVRMGKTPTDGVKLVHLGTHPLKATLLTRLTLQVPESGRPPFGYVLFRGPDPGWHNGADAEFFAQFAREKPKPKRLPNGKWVTEWKATGANEAIDLMVGNMGMLHVLGPDTRQMLGLLAEQAAEPPEPTGPHLEPPPPEDPDDDWAYSWRR